MDFTFRAAMTLSGIILLIHFVCHSNLGKEKDSLINSAGLKHASGSQEDKEKGARPCIKGIVPCYKG